MSDFDPRAPRDPREQPRQRTRAEERIAGLDTSPARLTAELDQLRAELATAQQEAAENKAAWQRSAADFSNYRRRTEQEREAMVGLANEVLLAKLLAIVDDFDRAIANMPAELQNSSWTGGIAAIDRKLRQLLESEGLTPIEALGKQFDPHEHEAIAQEDRPGVPDGTVIAELQKGYRIRDRVLRPAMVAIARHTTTDNQPDPNINSGGLN
ncbi:MAG: molecular chaperone GrpE [Chloroflexota bacterium]|jgi:molecular chaperone GrpE|nr:molecular chaperone GrpE [Chloroflexota bacterium]